MEDDYSAAIITVRNDADIDRMLDRLRMSAEFAHNWIASFGGDPLQMLRAIKFDQIGQHPISHHKLNLVEQINQTWTYTVALLAARQLIRLHPDADGFRLAPGAHGKLRLDIMSVVEGLVGAETFAATHPRSNNKLAKDLKKLSGHSERFRYAFFMSPAFPGNVRLPQFERNGVQVWSVDPPLF